jgi:hypothetical protein
LQEQQLQSFEPKNETNGSYFSSLLVLQLGVNDAKNETCKEHTNQVFGTLETRSVPQSIDGVEENYFVKEHINAHKHPMVIVNNWKEQLHAKETYQ